MFYSVLCVLFLISVYTCFCMCCTSCVFDKRFAGRDGRHVLVTEFWGMVLNGLFCADVLRPLDLVPRHWLHLKIPPCWRRQWQTRMAVRGSHTSANAADSTKLLPLNEHPVKPDSLRLRAGKTVKTVRSPENTCHTWALLRWCFTNRCYIKCTHLYLYPKTSDVNKDWTCKDEDKDKDQAYKD